MNTQRKILVTSALPYANGDIHLGHMVEHIQTDIWVRFQKMRGHECYYVCADDTHGTPVMLAAQKQGLTPETMIEQVHQQHLQDFTGFLINYDNYYSTHSIENKEFSQEIYQKLKQNNKIISRSIEQLFDPEKNMFLPDRFVKGECPKCHAKDQYGDNCEVCGTTYSPKDLIKPYSTISGAQPILKESEHFFFRLSECLDFLKQWTQGSTQLVNEQKQAHLQAEALNKMNEWIEGGLQDWDISRDAPYFGFEIPDAPGKYFYVWLDAPIGYMASFKNFCTKNNIDFDAFFTADTKTEMYHFIGKDILYFHALFWPAVLKYAGLRTPTAIFAHGFLTVNGQKMSKSRGTFITAKSYLSLGLNPEWIRYYIAAKLNNKIEDIDLNLEDFIARVNSDLIGKYINIASRASGFIHKRFSGQLQNIDHSDLLQQLKQAETIIAQAYENREYAKVLRHVMELADIVNSYVDNNKPWELAKQEGMENKLHEVCSELLNAFKILTVYLAPVLPNIAKSVADFLNIADLQWQDSQTDLGTQYIKPYKHLMTRVEPELLDKLVAMNKQSMQETTLSPTTNTEKVYEPIAPTCSFDDFLKVDLRVAEVLNCEKVEGSKKLLKFHLNLGFEERTIFSGIAASYSEPKKLIGRKVIIVANFAPRQMAKFGLSEGMITSAASENQLFLLDVDSGAQAGMKVG